MKKSATPPSGGKKTPKRAGKALMGSAPLATTGDPLTGAAEIAAALKAAAYSLEEIAPAVVAQGVYSELTSLQLSRILVSPSLFPATTREQLIAALRAARFSQAEIDLAIATLFPTRGPLKDGAILTFKSLGRSGKPGYLWLAGKFADATVGLAPTAAGGAMSTRWKAHAKSNNVYTFECLGGGPSPARVWLDGRTNDGTVGLAPNTTAAYSGTWWKVTNQSDNSYWLDCLGVNANPRHTWLASGQAAADRVGLAPTPAGGLDVNAIAHVYYQTHVSSVGWMPEVSDVVASGGPNLTEQLEAFKVRIPGRHVFYQAHVAERGWLAEVSDGAEAGTTREQRRLEAVRIRVDKGHVYYQAYVETVGWMAEVSDGAEAGTTGRRLKLLALKIRTEDTTPQGFNAAPWEAAPPQYRRVDARGSNATAFDDTDAALLLNQPLTKLRVQAGEIIDGLQAFYGRERTALPLHGGEGGTRHEIVLDDDDYLTKVTGSYGRWLSGTFILQLTLRTKKGKTYGPYGTMSRATGITAFTMEANNDEQIVAFHGQSGGHLNAIGLTLQPV